MPKIIQLSPHIANLIAAGEVVERPASVVKELLENAVDAGASQVTVEIKDGGMTFLRVTDNGCGMSPEDARTAFARHATSKLRTAEDLAAIGTMGFRGEALAAIASVSRIDLLTKTPGAVSGVSLRLEGGTVLEEGEAGCPDGTTIIIRDLFFNTPARMKFMKSDTVEGSRVAAAVQQQALAHPETAFRFIKDGKQVLQTPGSGQLQDALYCVYGRECAKMVMVDSRWDQYSVCGYVTKPTDARPSRSMQTFFVNNRPVKSRLLISALEEAYRNQIMAGKFPGCVLHLTVPHGAVDVNVHPAKTEVKFLNEKAVFDCIHYGILAALNKQSDRPQIQLDKKPPLEDKKPPLEGRCPEGAEGCKPKISSPLPHLKGEPKPFFRTMTAEEYKTFSAALQDAPQPKKEAAAAAAAKIPQPSPLPLKENTRLPGRTEALIPVSPKPPLEGKKPPLEGKKPPLEEKKPPLEEKKPPLEGRCPEGAEGCKPKVSSSVTPQSAAQTAPLKGEPLAEQISLEMPPEQPWRMVGELFSSYIAVEQGDEVFLIDKHAAHERILFEKLKANQEAISAQTLLSPLPVRLSPAACGELLSNRDMLEELGFEIDEFGDNTVLLRQIPMDLSPELAADALENLAADLLKGRREKKDTVRDELLHTVACKAAIKAGWKNDEAELMAVARQVMEREDLKYCPHGRPICITLTKKQLEKQFKRT